MKSLVIASLTLAAGLLAAAPPALAQVYRCGNEYTNQIKGRTDCKPVSTEITVIEGSKVPVSSPAPTPTPPTPAPDLNAPDPNAKAALEQKLRSAEAAQAELVKTYNNGQPDKIGGEAKNYQKYLDRVAAMKADIERNQKDIDGMKSQLGQ